MTGAQIEKKKKIQLMTTSLHVQVNVSNQS